MKTLGSPYRPDWGREANALKSTCRVPRFQSKTGSFRPAPVPSFGFYVLGISVRLASLRCSPSVSFESTPSGEKRPLPDPYDGIMTTITAATRRKAGADAPLASTDERYTTRRTLSEVGGREPAAVSSHPATSTEPPPEQLTTPFAERRQVGSHSPASRSTAPPLPSTRSIQHLPCSLSSQAKSPRLPSVDGNRPDAVGCLLSLRKLPLTWSGATPILPPAFKLNRL